jgi:hypothetical protein
MVVIDATQAFSASGQPLAAITVCCHTAITMTLFASVPISLK